MGVYREATDIATSYVGSLQLQDWNENELPIEWPLTKVDDDKPVHSKPYIAIDVAKTRAEKRTVESGECGVERAWLLRINLHVPKGVGQMNPESVIDDIVSAFPNALTLTGDTLALEVTNTNPINPVPSGAWIVHPVLITLEHIS